MNKIKSRMEKLLDFLESKNINFKVKTLKDGSNKLNLIQINKRYEKIVKNKFNYFMYFNDSIHLINICNKADFDKFNRA